MLACTITLVTADSAPCPSMRSTPAIARILNRQLAVVVDSRYRLAVLSL
jgi:hypothetical protein